MKYILVIMGIFYFGIFAAIFIIQSISIGFLRANVPFEKLSGLLMGSDFSDIFIEGYLNNILNEIGNVFGIFNASRYAAAATSICISIVLAACLLSRSVSRYFIKEHFATMHTKKGFWALLIRTIISWIFTFITFILAIFYIKTIYITIPILFILEIFETLISSKYIYYPDIKLKEFLKLKMIGGMALSYLILIAIIAIFGIILALLLNPVFTSLILIPFAIYIFSFSEAIVINLKDSFM